MPKIDPYCKHFVILLILECEVVMIILNSAVSSALFGGG